MKNLLQQLHQRPIAYYPIYRDITGSTTAGILLSQLMYWFSIQDKIYKTDAEIMQEVKLTKKELENAKKLIKKVTFLTVSLEGVPAKTFYKIDWKKYQNLLTKFVEKNGGNKIPPKGETVLPKTEEQDSTKGGNRVPPKGETINDISMTETTTETTTEILSSLPSLKPKIKREREDFKKTFLNFINDLRKKYKGNSINSFYPILTVYDDQEIKVASNGYLYFATSTEYLDPTQAQDVWSYLYKNPQAVCSIMIEKSKQGEAS